VTKSEKRVCFKKNEWKEELIISRGAYLISEKINGRVNYEKTPRLL